MIRQHVIPGSSHSQESGEQPTAHGKRTQQGEP
ncbi:hypothetical protein AN403_5999 [Pseudomonas fluorescens]|uniref:Uncharacterized protein n=1 Tax=Pseudomonas fluorescens TaxID=294 RepID=A0A0P8X758_PSEFL|nr:hypothetical protein AN403_5999 [Pseudomonas fluorescens]